MKTEQVATKINTYNAIKEAQLTEYTQSEITM